MTGEPTVDGAGRTRGGDWLAGRGAVVTGGGRGIGSAVAHALVGAGAKVVVAARSTDEIEVVAERLGAAGARAHAVSCDVSDQESVAKMADRARELLGAVDILVNNAGISGSALRVKVGDWEAMHRVNATGPLLVTQALLPAMLERGWGRIVNVASVVGLKGARYISSYAASKHALLGMTRCLADELAGTGVTVNSVCPGYVDTPMTTRNIGRIAEATGRDAAAVRQGLEEMQPSGRFVSPGEVAHAVLSFLPEAADSLQGSELIVRSGSTGSGS
ncbi:MAG: SDR family oxidoreductase [Gemmatimonadetes bacterium]|nr:SDR family oxidoreductase [Gemmatimonadota bacterium]